MATDLGNTAPEVRRQRGEALPDTAALGEFLERHDLGSRVSGMGGPTDRDLAEVHALRRRTQETLRAGAEDEIVEAANALVATVGLTLGLRRTDVEPGWQWYGATATGVTVADELAVLIGLGILGALRALGPARFRSCAAPDCIGVFVDTSRAGRRRYCTPELCGNRLNVAHHRARQRNQSDGSGAATEGSGGLPGDHLR